MGHGAVGKLFFRWSQPWWRKYQNQTESCFGFTFVWTKEELSGLEASSQVDDDFPQETSDWVKGLFNLNSVENQPNLLVAWVMGSCAKVLESLPDEQVRYLENVQI